MAQWGKFHHAEHGKLSTFIDGIAANEVMSGCLVLAEAEQMTAASQRGRKVRAPKGVVLDNVQRG